MNESDRKLVENFNQRIEELGYRLVIEQYLVAALIAALNKQGDAGRQAVSELAKLDLPVSDDGTFRRLLDERVRSFGVAPNPLD